MQMITRLLMMCCSIKYPSMSSKKQHWQKIMLFLKSRFWIWRINVRSCSKILKRWKKIIKKKIRGYQEDIVWDLTMITTRSKTWETTSNTQEQCWYNSFRSYHIHLPIMKQPYQSYIPCLNSQRKNKLNLLNKEKSKTKPKCKKMLKINLKSCLEECSKINKKVKLQDPD